MALILVKQRFRKIDLECNFQTRNLTSLRVTQGTNSTHRGEEWWNNSMNKLEPNGYREGMFVTRDKGLDRFLSSALWNELLSCHFLAVLADRITKYCENPPEMTNNFLNAVSITFTVLTRSMKKDYPQRSQLWKVDRQIKNQIAEHVCNRRFNCYSFIFISFTLERVFVRYNLCGKHYNKSCWFCIFTMYYFFETWQTRTWVSKLCFLKATSQIYWLKLNT